MNLSCQIVDLHVNRKYTNVKSPEDLAAEGKFYMKFLKIKLTFSAWYDICAPCVE